MSFTVVAVLASLFFTSPAFGRVPLEQAVAHGILRYGIPRLLDHVTLLIESFTENQQTHKAHWDLMDGILRLLRGRLPIQYWVAVGGQPAAHNLIMVDGNSSFQRFVTGWTLKRYDLAGCYWIVLDDRSAIEDAASYVLGTLWDMRIVTGFIFLEDEKGAVELFSYQPYSASHCGIAKPRQVHWEKDDIFSDRLREFHGCPLKFGTFDNRPYIDLTWDYLGRLSLDGFEGLLVNLIAKNLNFTIDVVIPSDNAMWGYSREDGRSTGLMKLLQDETVDFSASSIGYTIERSKILSTGVTHYNSYIVFAVPSGRAYSSFEKLFLPFLWDTWYAIFGTLVIAIGIIVFMNARTDFVRDLIYGTAIRAPISNLFNVLFGGPMVRCPHLTFARTLLGLWMLYCLVIRAAYQCSLYKYLQVPKNFSAPLTIDAMLAAGLYFYMLDLAAEFFSDNPEVLARTRFVSHANGAFVETINAVGRDELDGAMVCLSDHIGYHNKFYPPEEFVHCSKETICGFPMSIAYPKRTFLKEAFDREIQLIDSSGLVGFWASQLIDMDFYTERKSNAIQQALTVDNLLGAFEILLAMEGVAVLLFLVELATIRLRFVRKILDWAESD
ncbi:uncharacterized protein LOC129758145 [Uranotaenia lowii]|uniref:uncharacterized protein LOC129758145 n=1 Tax=Uranotaenia lowii TaxID=190385 RepID=UPI002478DA16|nr:uncharacterized protein LOC129758145 [Uranotaenia lowii]